MHRWIHAYKTVCFFFVVVVRNEAEDCTWACFWLALCYRSCSVDTQLVGIETKPHEKLSHSQTEVILACSLENFQWTAIKYDPNSNHTTFSNVGRKLSFSFSSFHPSACFSRSRTHSLVLCTAYFFFLFNMITQTIFCSFRVSSTWPHSKRNEK